MPVKHCDAAAKRGILLLKRTSEALRRDPPDLRGALAECQAAVQEDPDNPEVLRIYGCFLSNVGQRKAAQQQFEAALAVDPASDVIILSYSELLYAGVDDERSPEFSEKRLEEGLLQAHDLLTMLLQQPQLNQQVAEKARKTRAMVQEKLQQRDFAPIWSSTGFHNVQAKVDRLQSQNHAKTVDASTALKLLVEARNTLDQDLANIIRLEKDKVFDKASAALQKKEANQRFEKIKAELTGNPAGVSTSREAAHTENDAGVYSSDEEETDAALSRVVGVAQTKKKKRSFFMCMPIPSL
jgi:tetratricopeptide (TPR) repeat protein